MARIARTWLVALLALCAAAPASAAAARTDLRLVECRPGEGGDARSATFQGRMRSVPGAARMEMRFVLLERVGDGVFHRVEVPGMGVWRRSREGAARFVYRQNVVGLRRDAAYRAQVAFRWIAPDGSVLRTARRRSPACGQAQSLPDLLLGSLGVVPSRASGDGTVLYTLEVRNRGSKRVDGVDVVLIVDGAIASRVRSGPLGASETTTVEASGPPCRESVTVAIDPQDRVREGDERDNTRTLPCP